MSTKNVLIHADETLLDGDTTSQIWSMANHPATSGLISIMPDCHGGKGSVIGFTGRFKDAVIPNVVGVDIGCGVSSHPIFVDEINFEKFDEYLRKNIPNGFKKATKPINERMRLYNATGGHKSEVNDAIDLANTFLHRVANLKDPVSPELQLGTLGGGNHFIEVNYSEETGYWLTIHSGSRNYGLQIANYHQKIANELCKKMLIKVPSGLQYLPMDKRESLGHAYMSDMFEAQRFAALNREVMTRIALSFFNLDFDTDAYIECIHNFISPHDHVVRKGAISAHKGEDVLIPLNMRDGLVVGKGKGNSAYNNSAPHGAGRMFSRTHMKELLRTGVITLDQFTSDMSDVFTTSVCTSTIDESPSAYKPWSAIESYLKETVDIDYILKPVYNLKSSK